MIGFALGHYNKNQTQLKRSLLYCYFQASRFVMEPNRDIGRILPLLISWSACQIHIGFVSIGQVKNILSPLVDSWLGSGTSRAPWWTGG